MGVSVIIGVLMSGLALFCKAMEPQEASKLLLWLSWEMVVMVRRLLVFAVAGTVLLGAMAGAERRRARRRAAEVKKKLMKARGGPCYVG